MQTSNEHGTTLLGPELGNRSARYVWLTVEVRYICSFFFSKTEAEGKAKEVVTRSYIFCFVSPWEICRFHN